MDEQILTVSELTKQIKDLLEPSFHSVLIRGEISNFKLQSSGHLYFSLKDESSQISAALFKGNAARLSRMPKDGDQVIAVGQISLYVPRGQYQIIVKELQFAGIGALLMKLHELKTTLEKRGWFDPKYKKPLPKYPKRIGVVTSPTGAVIQDILNVLKRRFSGFQVLLNPVKVQGDGAAEEIAKGIEDLNRYNLVDLIIVGRGGGSVEDLWAFNEEIVAKAIFESRIPIISAVGHETDFTIADWVADVRAPTPSAAAEIATEKKENLTKVLEQSKTFIMQRMKQKIEQAKRELKALRMHPTLASPYGVLSPVIQRLDEYVRRVEMLHPKNKIEDYRKKLTRSQAHLEALSPMGTILKYRDRLTRAKNHLYAMNPKNLLKKGYVILFNEKKSSIILSSKELHFNQKIKAQMHDGIVDLTVEGREDDN